MAKQNNKLSTKQKVFGIFLIIASLVMCYYGFSSGFKTISSSRFILGGIFILILAVALFKDKVNTKPMGLVLLGYLILDILLVMFASTTLSFDSISEFIFIIAVAYFIFWRRDN